MPPKLNRGFLFVIEGIDGAGKTTQARRLHDALRDQGLDCVMLREPTDGPFGQRIRQLAVAGRDAITPEEELELFVRDREQNVRENIQPALSANRIVILDRYYFSTMAYQGALGLDIEHIRLQNEAIAPIPDRVIIMDIPLNLVKRRIVESRGEAQNLFEKLDYLANVKANFDQMKFDYIHRIDAAREPDLVFAELKQLIQDAIAPSLQPTD